MAASFASTAPPGSCDLVVVGGGLAGAELAGELERRGARDVAVLDAGPADDLLHTNLRYGPQEALRRWLKPATDRYFSQPWTSRFPPHYTGSSGIRQRVGGRSLYWYGVAIPVEEWALRAPWWPDPVVHDLTRGWGGGAPLYDRVAAKLAAWQSPAGALADTLSDVTLAGHRLGLAPRATRTVEGVQDRWYAYSPLDRWRDPESGHVRRPPLGVSFHAGIEVIEVQVNRGTAGGVLARRAGTTETFEISANRVVLAAGTMSSTRLAIQALSDVEAIHGPRLAGLCDHMVQGVFLRLPGGAASRLLATLPPANYYARCPGAARSNLFLDLQVLDDGSVLIDLQLTGEQMPSPESYVECDPNGARPWPIAVHSRPSETDRVMLQIQREILQEALDELLAKAGRPSPTLTFDSFDNPRRTNEIVLTERTGPMTGAAATWSGFLGTEDHEGGTLPLGGVVGADHQFVDVRGLYAVGPPTFPRIGAANVGLTALALSHRLAAVLTAGGPVSRSRDREGAWAISR